ncbi:MAG: hypothetical protein WC326_08155 [Candidatus Delongbacteria bacterium]
MFLVTAKTTTVVIGMRVFSPVLASRFEDELPPDVAGRDDLLLIEEIPDEEPVVEPGGLTATGTLETDPGGAGEGDTGAGGAPDGAGLGEGAGTAGEGDTGVGGAPDGEGPGEGAGTAGEGGTGAGGAQDGQGPETDPTLLTDKALTEGVTLLRVGGDDDDDDGPGADADPDPFADTTEGPGTPGAETPAPAQAPPASPPAPSAPATSKGGRGGRNSRK